MEDILWGLMIVVGPVLLLSSMVWGVIAFRRGSPATNVGLSNVDVDHQVIDSPPLIPLAIRDQTRIG
jgi:hypothetical protein